ncbi:RHS repeat-associated protein [Micromonospora pisi]|uniref:RHS repeat-associated protein n=1 Tax=Micromonospora pisi TaxID=589240 RepID=A0A495JD60_9ACTN|nr:RHS repeat-associated core domain-containing protein [Micromonospora pisi]RKR86671.1 RHS repeat-associated protein [Micromonospora pisi]
MTRLGRLGQGVALASSAVLAATLVGAAPAAAAVALWQPPTPENVTGVAVQPVKHPVRPAWTASDHEVQETPAVNWPAGTASVDLTAATSPTAASNTTGARTASASERSGIRADGLPVWVARTPTPVGQDMLRSTGAPATVVNRVSVEVADRNAATAAGVSGLLLKVRRSDGVRGSGVVDLHVDYSGFAGAYGGDWSSRLHVVTVPGGKPLASTNDPATSTVSASVPLAADGTTTSLAVTAGASGDNGDYSATSLSPASSWQVSQQTGAFAWSYPLRAVPAIGGPEPSLGLSYSSSSVDGRTGGTNTQGSWIGDGWDLWPGYIERQYKGCADDKDAVNGVDPNNKSVSGGDQCWAKPEGNATISLNGRSTELVKSAGNTWKGVSDDGSRIELLKDTTLGNGDTDGEYWKVTTVDGTQYFFGRNLAPGGASASTPTNSVWTEPVYGNHPGEPGYVAGDFAASRQTQGWRWNLDQVVDPHGNTMTYFYEKEAGAYGREGDPTKRTAYDRGGWLSRVEYGNRIDAPATTHATAQVLFDVADRCDTNCFSGTDPVTVSWPDTPWDQYCKAAPCTDQTSPTFWTQKRLSRIRAQVYSGSGSTYNEVEWWTLRHTYLQTGSNEGKPMWLAGITHTGKVTSAGGAEASDPEVVFDPGAEAPANRVDGPADGRSNLFRFRINTITTESGAQIAVTYSPTECTRSTLPSPSANGKRCFPQYYAPQGEEPTLDWFHKYVVNRIDVYDNTGGFSHEQTNYDYIGTPAWHYDDSELVAEKKRTWGDFRGYQDVRVRQGLESGPQTTTEYFFLRGMDGDKQPSGVRDVWFTDSQGTKVEDHEALSGFLREEIVWSAATGGTILSGSIHDPSIQGPTATSGPLKAWMTNTGTTRERTALPNGSMRWTKNVTSFNADNLPVQVDDLGDEATTADDQCIRTWYARNTANWMLNRIKRTETVGVGCAATPTLPGDMLTSNRITYDAQGNNWDTYLPVKGDAAKVEQIGSWSGTTPNWVTTAHSTYDANGRTTETYDALDQRIATAYTPASGGPVNSVTVTNPLGQTATTTYVTAWNVPATTVDPNNARTDLTYDGLGRMLAVWLPGRPKATNATTPNSQFSYLVRNNAPSAVTTKTLLPSTSAAYQTEITLYDGLLRQRQTQTQAHGGGRLLTDTVYDSRGLVDWTSNPYYDTSNTAPNTTLVAGAGTPAIPAVTRNVYDGAGRLTNAILMTGSTEKWRTTTSYGGDRTSVVPPKGGTATTTILDAMGRATELRQYKDPTNVGSDNPATFDRTAYTYTDRNELAAVTDPAGNTWRYSYDQLGRKIKDEDPDKGVSTSTYDLAGQLLTTTDARNVTIAYTYDKLGRKTSTRDGSVTGNKRAEWVYDTLTNGIGHLTKSVRYEPAGSTNAYVNETVGYDTASRPTGSKLTLPAAESGLCAAGGTTPCTYTYATTYRPDGQVASATLPAQADLPSEKLTYTYTDVGAPDDVISAQQTYTYDVTYNKLGQLTQRVLGDEGFRTWVTSTIDEPTGRVTNTSALPELKPEIFNNTYSYDDAGNITKIADTPNSGQTADVQCFGYDYLRRLGEAWTPGNGDCNPQTRSVAGLGGPAPYWQSYTYDAVGNRLTDTRHAATNTTRTYTYPAQGGAAGSKPHAVTQVVTTGAGSRTDNYTYDASGNTKTRPGGTNGQTLTWDNEDHLATVADSTGTSSYLYDADGDRLISRDPGGATLYLPDGSEIRKPTSGTATGTRYYSHAGTTIAMRTAAGLSWLVGDHHGTAEATISNTNMAVARRRTTPFGEIRGTTTGTWPSAMDKGFVGGTNDKTGLTHLGAREYDASLGRFISVDQVLDVTDPQQMNGYSYSNNSPTTLSDASGLRPECGSGSVYDSCDNAVPAAPGSHAAQTFGGWSNNKVGLNHWGRPVLHVRKPGEEPAKPRESDKPKKNWFEKTMDVVSAVAPVLTTVALATSFIPGVDVLTFGMAAAVEGIILAADIADALSTGYAAYKFMEDVEEGASTNEKLADAGSAVLGLAGVSLGGIYKFKGIAGHKFATAAAAKATADGAQRALAAAKTISRKGGAAGGAAKSSLFELRQSRRALSVASDRAMSSATKWGWANAGAKTAGFVMNAQSDPWLVQVFG